MVKSAAKIRRNTARAAARGETYSPPPPATSIDGDDGGETTNATGSKRTDAGPSSSSSSSLSKKDGKRFDIAKKLRDSLTKLEKDTTINAKERRSARRKAEAIAIEELKKDGGGGGEEEDNMDDVGKLLEWYDAISPPPPPPTTTTTGGKRKKDDDVGVDDDGEKRRKIPYILFVGQLSYDTTSEMLFEHFRKTLGSKVVTESSVKIRLLVNNDVKDKRRYGKSRGMAFVELDSPEVMYECLKLHLTHLDGRRINVERSAGGGSTAKKARITSYRENQTTFISKTMDSILSGFVKNGDISSEELDDGVIGLCKRHSATVVEAALKEYVNEKMERKLKRETLGEKEEEELRNPSAFLTHMIGRIAEEGVGNSSLGKRDRDVGGGGGRDSGRGRGGRGGRDGGRGGGPGRGGGGGRGGRDGNGGGDPSILQRSGVDMSISSRMGSDDISRIFPSMQRGRGRGRGYM